jgi:tetrahydromethanopterin S-methyltransferase subunit A
MSMSHASMDDANAPQLDEATHDQPHPEIVGDVVFGSMDSPVAVCTLASRTLLPELAGHPEIAIAGRVFTENVGIERMVQNLVAFASIQYLIVCGRETPHHVGNTILALHQHGLDESGRVIGSNAPEPLMPNLSPSDIARFQEHITVVDLIGETDATVILSRAADLGSQRVESGAPVASQPAEPNVEHIVSTRDPASAWTYDPTGYFLIFVDRAHAQLRIEHYTQEHRLQRVIWGRGADEISHTILRLGLVTLMPHAAYLGRELGRAESALRLGVHYEQDRPLPRHDAAEGKGTH